MQRKWPYSLLLFLVEYQMSEPHSRCPNMEMILSNQRNVNAQYIPEKVIHIPN